LRSNGCSRGDKRSDLRAHPVSTRRLILAALLCGLAILVAAAIQLAMIAD